MTIAADLSNFAFSAAGVNTGGFTMRNKIINGAMVIDQRNAGASVTPTDTTGTTYTVDRWYARVAQSSKLSYQRSSIAPDGFSNSILLTSLSAYSLTSTDHFGLTQPIEGYNITDFAWGTSSATSATLSFWVRSSLTGIFGGHISNNGSSTVYIFNYTINAANTWEYKTIIISASTSGTWTKDNTAGLYCHFSVGAGSSVTSSAGSWGSFYRSVTGQTSLVGTNGATFYITGVQLEKGTSATPFEYRNYQQELAMCQRYWFQSETISFFYYAGSGQMHSQIEFPVKMRTVPTVTYYPTVADMYARTNAGYITKDGTGNVAASQVNSGIDTDACYHGSQGANCRVARTANAEL